MSLQTSRSLSQLQLECENLKLEVKLKGKKLQKDDYIRALREYYIESYGGYNAIPKSLNLMLQIESPMLAAQYKTCKEAQQDKMWNTNDWYAEEKEDGVRIVNFFLQDENYNAYSRNNSTKDFLPISYGEKICLDNVDFSKIRDTFILDSECICTNPRISTVLGKRGIVTETQLQAVTALVSMNKEDSIRIQREESCPLLFKVFDCLYYNGEWLLDKPLIERRKYLKKALQQLQLAGFKAQLPKSNISNKKAFYNALIKEHKEGIILKKIDSKYTATSSRAHRDWVKVKRSFSETAEMEGLCDTIDGFITGFESGSKDKANSNLVGTLIVSTYLRDEEGNTKLHEIAHISSITDDLRKEITTYDSEGNPVLKESFYNQVVEVDGQCISARAMRLRHAVLVRFRPDRSSDTCILDESFLRALIL